jgi:predicted MFS family arabinose efflux permease
VADQAIGRRAINLLNPAARGRLNGLFTGLFFLGSAGGAAVSGLTWALGGWLAVCSSAGLLVLAASFSPPTAHGEFVHPASWRTE